MADSLASMNWLDQDLLDQANVSVHVTGGVGKAELGYDPATNQRQNSHDEKEGPSFAGLARDRPVIKQIVHQFSGFGAPPGRKAVIGERAAFLRCGQH